MGRCLTYLQKWYDYENSFFKNVTLLSLSNDIQWPELLSLVEHLGITIDSDKLYDEFCVLRKARLELVSSNSNVADR